MKSGDIVGQRLNITVSVSVIAEIMSVARTRSMSVDRACNVYISVVFGEWVQNEILMQYTRNRRRRA